MMKLKLTQDGFSLLEIIIAMTVFIVVFSAVVDSMSASNQLRKQANERLLMWSQSESMLNYLADGISKGRVDVVNMSEDGDEYKGYNYIEWTPYEHGASDEIEYDAPQDMSHTEMLELFPRLNDNWQGNTDHLPDQLAPGVKLDKSNLPGFYAIMDETNYVVYLGVSLTQTVDGNDVNVNYTSEVILRRDLHDGTFTIVDGADEEGEADPEEPPVEEPPAEEPPAEEPPVAEEPPAEEPPVAEEPAEPTGGVTGKKTPPGQAKKK